MSSARSNIRKAAIEVAEKIRTGQVADIAEELTGGDLEGYVAKAAIARLKKDEAAFVRTMRDAAVDLASEGVGMQIAIPGMEHSTLPFVVFDRDPETGNRVCITAPQATLDQIDREVTAQERRAAVRGRIVGGWRATVEAVRAAGVDGQTTGAEIAERFGREIGS